MKSRFNFKWVNNFNGLKIPRWRIWNFFLNTRKSKGETDVYNFTSNSLCHGASDLRPCSLQAPQFNPKHVANSSKSDGYQQTINFFNQLLSYWFKDLWIPNSTTLFFRAAIFYSEFYCLHYSRQSYHLQSHFRILWNIFSL